jgi:hypothetical protein
VVSLSDAGRQQLEAWERAHVQRIQAALGRIDPGDRGAIAAALPALRRLTWALSEG